MEFRRSAHRHERRRRVLMDEASVRQAGSAAVGERGRASTDSAPASVARRYSPAALAERQPPITSLIADRWWTLAIQLLVVLTVTAAIHAAYGAFFLHPTALPTASLAAFDLAARGSLNCLFSAVLLSLAAGNSSLVYLIRRHKIDDYRGRYRLWLWNSALLSLAAVATASDLHTAASALAADAIGSSASLSLVAWWLVPTWLAIAALGLPIALEFRACRLACGSLLAAMTLYVASSIIRADVLPALNGPFRIILLSLLTTLGHTALWLATCIYARHVFLDAQGRLPSRPARRKRRRTATAKAGTSVPAEATDDSPPAGKRDGQRVRFDASHEDGPTPQSEEAEQARGEPGTAEQDEPEQTRPARRKRPSRAAQKAAAPPAADIDDQDEAEDGGEMSEAHQDDPDAEEPSRKQKLTKAERRKLRKQRRREAV